MASLGRDIELRSERQGDSHSKRRSELVSQAEGPGVPSPRGGDGLAVFHEQEDWGAMFRGSGST